MIDLCYYSLMTSNNNDSEQSTPPHASSPPLSELRPMAYRLFLAGVGLYAITQEQISEMTSRWITQAEALEEERRARMVAKLTQTHGRVASPRYPALDELDLDLLETYLPSREDVHTISQRLDTLLTRLEELDSPADHSNS